MFELECYISTVTLES